MNTARRLSTKFPVKCYSGKCQILRFRRLGNSNNDTESLAVNQRTNGHSSAISGRMFSKKTSDLSFAGRKKSTTTRRLMSGLMTKYSPRTPISQIQAGGSIQRRGKVSCQKAKENNHSTAMSGKMLNEKTTNCQIQVSGSLPW